MILLTLYWIDYVSVLWIMRAIENKPAWKHALKKDNNSNRRRLRLKCGPPPLNLYCVLCVCVYDFWGNKLDLIWFDLKHRGEYGSLSLKGCECEFCTFMSNTFRFNSNSTFESYLMIFFNSKGNSGFQREFKPAHWSWLVPWYIDCVLASL